MGDDFDDGGPTAGLTTSTSGVATISETGGEHVLSGGAADADAGISVTTNALVASKQFAIRNMVKVVSGGTVTCCNPESKLIGVVESATQPTVTDSATENPRRRIRDGSTRLVLGLLRPCLLPSLGFFRAKGPVRNRNGPPDRRTRSRFHPSNRRADENRQLFVILVDIGIELSELRAFLLLCLGALADNRGPPSMVRRVEVNPRNETIP